MLGKDIAFSFWLRVQSTCGSGTLPDLKFLDSAMRQT